MLPQLSPWSVEYLFSPELSPEKEQRLSFIHSHESNEASSKALLSKQKKLFPPIRLWQTAITAIQRRKEKSLGKFSTRRDAFFTCVFYPFPQVGSHVFVANHSTYVRRVTLSNLLRVFWSR